MEEEEEEEEKQDQVAQTPSSDLVDDRYRPLPTSTSYEDLHSRILPSVINVILVVVFPTLCTNGAMVASVVYCME